eukprot:TRINITY_DN6437_c0_g1_i1.p1 TRINITY_DN6437_c0_g1~~TRINITY_DN6437_c0_g1_i1.p1  ORF type:complete len:324 (-),score=57.09 TRINITY_DN6437_c0_g1_i1:230-1201(-)
MSQTVSSIACVDLSSPDLEGSASLLRKACLDTGFFYVVNHGISEEFMQEVFEQSRRFFKLPMEQKMKLLRSKKHRGYTPIHDESLDPDRQIVGDFKEGYYIGVEVSDDDPRAKKSFYGPNTWPPEDLLPGWRQTMEKYHQAALHVGRRVASLIALSLNLDAGYFSKKDMLDEPIAVLRLLHYEGKVSNPELGIYGCGAHSDFGMITLLATDDTPGLQICKMKDSDPQQWEDIAPVKGAFIVNIGDMLERWSNGLYRSTMHRVIIAGKERYSIAYFLEPSHDGVVECLPTCCSETIPPKYPPIKCEDYLTQRYKSTHRDLSKYY